MTDVARRQARSQKHRLDTALLERRRRDALTGLGEILYELASNGEIELDELPELSHAVEEVAEIDRRIAEAEAADRLPVDARKPVRLGRTPGGRSPGRTNDSRERVWRPDREPDRVPGRAPDRGPDREIVRESWSRDHADNETDLAEHEPRADRGRRSARPARVPDEATRPRTRRATSADASSGGGGIVFVDDDSAPPEIDPDDGLESYMNADDIPRRR